jgi:hypothetical protein
MHQITWPLQIWRDTRYADSASCHGYHTRNKNVHYQHITLCSRVVKCWVSSIWERSQLLHRSTDKTSVVIDNAILRHALALNISHHYIRCAIWAELSWAAGGQDGGRVLFNFHENKRFLVIIIKPQSLFSNNIEHNTQG